MKYKIATILCETPLARIPFINQWIDDQFDRCEKHQMMTTEIWNGIDELLKDIELEEEEIKPKNVGDWLRRLSSEAFEKGD